MWIPQCAQCFLHFWRYNNIPWKPVCHWDFDILMWLLPSWCDFLPTRCYMGLMWLLPNWCDLNPSLVVTQIMIIMFEHVRARTFEECFPAFSTYSISDITWADYVEPGLGRVGLTLIIILVVLLLPIRILWSKQVESLEPWNHMQGTKCNNRGMCWQAVPCTLLPWKFEWF